MPPAAAGRRVQIIRVHRDDAKPTKDGSDTPGDALTPPDLARGFIQGDPRWGLRGLKAMPEIEAVIAYSQELSRRLVRCPIGERDAPFGTTLRAGPLHERTEYETDAYLPPLFA